jgi:hypothetical protein
MSWVRFPSPAPTDPPRRPAREDRQREATMGRMLSFRFVESGVEGGVKLNEEAAPVT